MDLKRNAWPLSAGWMPYRNSVLKPYRNSGMDASLFIASRLRFKGKIAAISIAVSFFVMIIAVAVSSGFRKEIRDSLSAISGDIQLTPPDLNVLDEGAPIESDASYLTHLKELECVKDVVPVIYRAGIVKAGENIHGVMVKATDRLPGLPERGDSASLAISIPGRLSEITGLGVGDQMTVYFVGEKVKVRKFHIVSLDQPLIQTDDKLVVHAQLSDMQRLNSWQANQVSAMEILLEDKWRDEDSIRKATQIVGYTVSGFSSESEHPVVATSSLSRYPQLFDWLNLIDFNVLFILVLMTIVAGFNMISGLLIMLFENISTIGLLKSLGMKDRAIVKVFLSSAAVLVIKGMLAGNLLALLLCSIQSSTHLLKLDPANYFVSFVPVEPSFSLILLADVVAFAVIMLLLLIPSLFIAKVDPAKTVKAD